MSTTKLYELKRGDKFYDMNGIIMVMIECIYDEKKPDDISYIGKQLKTGWIGKHSMHGPDVSQRIYFRYSRRDTSSFNAGFKMGIRRCLEHMQPNQIQAAGLEYEFNQYMSMLEEYQKWKENIIQ